MKVILPIKFYKKLRAYVEGIQYEISGLGKIEVIDNDIYVKDLQIFRQVVTGGNTILDKKALGKFYDELMQKDEDLSNWRLWWHSHAQMGVSWSAIDEETIEDFDNQMLHNNWMLSLVTNHSNKILMRVDIFAPLRCTIDDIDWEISFADKKMKKAIEDEITEKVTIYKFRPRKKWPKRTWWPKENKTGTETHKKEIILPEDYPDIPKIPIK